MTQQKKTDREIIQRGVELFPELSYAEVTEKLKEYRELENKEEEISKRKSLLGRSLEA